MTEAKRKRRRAAPAGIAPSEPERDILDQYLYEVSTYPLLKGDEEIALARKIRAGDQDALQELVKRNLRFVISVAKKYQNRGLPLIDLIGEGNVGLLTAARKFDPDQGVKFISYAVWWIRQAILSSLARQGRTVRVPLNRTADLSRIIKASEILRQKLRRERLDDVDRQAGELRELFGARLAVQLLPQDFRRFDDSRKVGGTVERHADRAALACERREDGLTDPPHGVGDEFDALVGVELSGGGEEADVAFTDQVDEGQSAVLVFLGDGDDEAQVALDELLERVRVAGADLFGEIDLLRTLEEGVRGDLVEVLVENVAFRFVGSDSGRGGSAAATLEFGHLRVSLARGARQEVEHL